MNAATDPLAALHPLRLPEPIGWWPPAPAWWLLGLVLLVSLALALRALWRFWRGNRYRRQALDMLAAAAARHARDGAAHAFVAEASAILRRAALVRYAHAEVASLCGSDWLRFLDRSAGTDHFSRGAGQALALAAYDPAAPVDVSALEQACRHWLRRHR